MKISWMEFVIYTFTAFNAGYWASEGVKELYRVPAVQQQMQPENGTRDKQIILPESPGLNVTWA